MPAQEKLKFLSDSSVMMKSLYKYSSLSADEVTPRRSLKEQTARYNGC